MALWLQLWNTTQQNWAVLLPLLQTSCVTLGDSRILFHLLSEENLLSYFLILRI